MTMWKRADGLSEFTVRSTEILLIRSIIKDALKIYIKPDCIDCKIRKSFVAIKDILDNTERRLLDGTYSNSKDSTD